MTHSLVDASDNFICSVQTAKEMYALIRTLRALNPRADEMFFIHSYSDGDIAKHRLGEVLR